MGWHKFLVLVPCCHKYAVKHICANIGEGEASTLMCKGVPSPTPGPGSMQVRLAELRWCKGWESGGWDEWGRGKTGSGWSVGGPAWGEGWRQDAALGQDPGLVGPDPGCSDLRQLFH